MDAVDAAIKSILDPSIALGFYHDRQGTPQLYSRSVAGFPFDIVYLGMDGEVYIVANAHERRRLGYGRSDWATIASSRSSARGPPRALLAECGVIGAGAHGIAQ